MSVLVYSESEKNSFKKSSYEAVSYGKSLADKMGVELICVTFNCSNSQKLKNFGADKIFNIESQNSQEFTCKVYSALLSKIIETENASTVILSSSPDSKYLGAYLAGYTGGSYISNVVEL